MVDACVLEVASSNVVISKSGHKPESTDNEGYGLHHFPRAVEENEITESQELCSRNREARQESDAGPFVALLGKITQSELLLLQILLYIGDLIPSFLVSLSSLVMLRKSFDSLLQIGNDLLGVNLFSSLFEIKIYKLRQDLLPSLRQCQFCDRFLRQRVDFVIGQDSRHVRVDLVCGAVGVEAEGLGGKLKHGLSFIRCDDLKLSHALATSDDSFLKLQNIFSISDSYVVKGVLMLWNTQFEGEGS